MRSATAAIRRQRSRHFDDTQLTQCSFDDHLTGKLHSRRSQVKQIDGFFTKASQAALKVSTRTVKEHSSDTGEQRIAEVPMKRRHCPVPDPSFKAVPHYQLIAVAQPLDKRS